MVVSKEERNRILRLVESGQVTAIQAAGLLDALSTEHDLVFAPGHDRVLRLRATNLQSSSHKTHVVATVPVSLIKISLRLGSNLFPQFSSNTLQDLLHTIERGATGRLLDMQDMENGERLEIFVE